MVIVRITKIRVNPTRTASVAARIEGSALHHFSLTSLVKEQILCGRRSKMPRARHTNELRPSGQGLSVRERITSPLCTRIFPSRREPAYLRPGSPIRYRKRQDLSIAWCYGCYRLSRGVSLRRQLQRGSQGLQRLSDRYLPSSLQPSSKENGANGLVDRDDANGEGLQGHSHGR
jgi:hypothetical protein